MTSIYREMLDHEQSIELNSQGNEYLNRDITIFEVENVIRNAKKNKSCGYDHMYIDIMDNIECKQISQKFSVCALPPARCPSVG